MPRASLVRRLSSDHADPTGTIADPQPYLVASDIFLLPSISEGISVAVSEAMAVGLPVLTAHAGALPEQLGANDRSDPADLGGVLVNHTLIDAADVDLYAAELASMLLNATRRDRLARNVMDIVRTSEDHADWRVSLKRLFGEIARARPWPRSLVKSLPHPAAALAIQSALTESWTWTDLQHVQARLKPLRMPDDFVPVEFDPDDPEWDTTPPDAGV